jgi:hypothetical protein
VAIGAGRAHPADGHPAGRDRAPGGRRGPQDVELGQKDAAELLGISPRVMNYKIKILNIEIPRSRRVVAPEQPVVNQTT